MADLQKSQTQISPLAKILKHARESSHLSNPLVAGNGATLSSEGLASAPVKPLHKTISKQITSANESSHSGQMSSIRRFKHGYSQSWDAGMSSRPGRVEEISLNQELSTILDGVDDNSAANLTRLTSLPIDSDKLQTQITEALSASADHDTMSPVTEAKSLQVKAQFEKKYSSLQSSSKQTRYNPLESLRQKKAETRTKISRKYGASKPDKQRHEDEQTQPGAEPSSSTKKPWSSLFSGGSKSKNSNEISNVSHIELGESKATTESKTDDIRQIRTINRSSRELKISQPNHPLYIDEIDGNCSDNGLETSSYTDGPVTSKGERDHIRYTHNLALFNELVTNRNINPINRHLLFRSNSMLEVSKKKTFRPYDNVGLLEDIGHMYDQKSSLTCRIFEEHTSFQHHVNFMDLGNVKITEDSLSKEDIETLIQSAADFIDFGIRPVEDLQAEIKDDMSEITQKLNIFLLVMNDLLLELNQTKNSVGELTRTASKVRRDIVTEWGYSALALVLNIVAFVFWAYSTVSKGLKRLFLLKAEHVDESERRESPSYQAETDTIYKTRIRNSFDMRSNQGNENDDISIQHPAEDVFRKRRVLMRQIEGHSKRT